MRIRNTNGGLSAIKLVFGDTTFIGTYYRYVYIEKKKTINIKTI